MGNIVRVFKYFIIALYKVFLKSPLLPLIIIEVVQALNTTL